MVGVRPAVSGLGGERFRGPLRDTWVLAGATRNAVRCPSPGPSALASAHAERVLTVDSYTLYRNETTYWPDGTVRSQTNTTVERNTSTNRWRYRERPPVPAPTAAGQPTVVAREIRSEGGTAHIRARLEDGTVRTRRLGEETFGALRLFGLSLDANYVALFGGLETRLAGRDTVRGASTGSSRRG
ncbi:hypothetical protein BRC93_07770 [Halobacteriales archaeon QS_5_70_15]|nr:MAG: hypothetical protein BRC93_07770 [Halobacteriales archaeon QS_5_70_15]